MSFGKVSLVLLGLLGSSALYAATNDSVPESCAKLVAALEACDKGPEGPFGTVRKACKEKAKSDNKCDLPVNKVRKMLKNSK